MFFIKAVRCASAEPKKYIWEKMEIREQRYTQKKKAKKDRDRE